MKANKLALISATLVISLLLLELLSLIAIKSYSTIMPDPTPNAHKLIFAKDGIDRHQRMDELRAIYETKATLEPYRWFALPRNYKGKFVSTDNYGFRNGPQHQQDGQTENIGFFGGSTMFGVTSKEEDTIPALIADYLKLERRRTFNFGIGSYSTSSELMTFVEVSRLKQYNIKHAVFYDGANEFTMYMQKIQDPVANPFYEIIGYPHYISLLAAASNYTYDMGGFVIQYKPAMVKIMEYIYARLNKKRNVYYSLLDDDIPHHAEIIYRIYVNNVLDIDAIAKSRNIQAVFIWQPNLLSIKRREFTDFEKENLEIETVTKKLYDAVNLKIRNGTDLKGVNFINMSDKFEALSKGEHFFDFAHVDAETNRLIAANIIETLRQFLPADDFKKRKN